MTTQAPTTEQIRNGWDSIAPGFDEYVTPRTMRLAQAVLSQLDIRPGTRLLDVGAGSGALAIPAARQGARVLAVDIAATMIERLRARAIAEGLADLEGRVADGRALEIDDDTFDVAVSLNGVSLFPDLAGGLAELVRVTKPGGKVALAAFGPPGKAEFLGFVMAAMRAALPGFTPPPADPPPLPFQVADPQVLHRKLSEAGLGAVTVEPVTWDMHFDSVAEFWHTFTSGNPVWAGLVANLDDAQRAQVRQVLEGMFRERSDGDQGATLHTEINLGVGTK